jgi:hypothetical protein
VLKFLGECGLKIINNDEIDQHHLWNWRVAQGLHGSYSYFLKEEPTSYKMKRPSHNQPYRTYSEDNSKDT